MPVAPLAGSSNIAIRVKVLGVPEQVKVAAFAAVSVTALCSEVVLFVPPKDQALIPRLNPVPCVGAAPPLFIHSPDIKAGCVALVALPLVQASVPVPGADCHCPACPSFGAVATPPISRIRIPRKPGVLE